MELSEQVCPLQQAKRLKELGITQEGIYTWLFNPLAEGWAISHQTSESLHILEEANPKSKEWAERKERGWYSAFTVAELGMMLPEKMKISRLDEYFLKYHRTDEPFGEDRPLWFSEPMINGLYGSPEHTTEAIMKADLLIYLLDNKHITAEEANKKLKA